MAAFSTTCLNVGVNGFRLNSSASMLSGSTGTSAVTFTCGALENVVIFGHNPSGSADISLTLTASTGRYASAGRGNRVLTTAMASSDWFFIGNLESAWFQSTSNTFVLTASTAIAIFAFELSSTRQI